MSSTAHDGTMGADGLRSRLPNDPANPRQATSTESAQAAVKTLNDEEEKTGKAEHEKRTYGRTPDGKVFTVPQTHDMVSQLLSPTQPKNASDIAIVTVLLWFVGMLVVLPRSASIPMFAVIFLFWRACYNAGIGYLLHIQSHHKRLTTWARRSGIFESPSTGKNSYPFLYKLLQREMETKIPQDYKFETAPLEYNTWLLFRRVVDLILMSDFTSYCCFAIACGGTPDGEKFFMTISRWVCGILLVVFNLWVKLDAHRVVKDYAWYWGDFFYLIDQELTFDGVFEMAPHPMYSVGYAGYYGISLMAASYKVLFISIIAHAAQFAFLYIVENPHIEKTYNPPPTPRKKSVSQHDGEREASSADGTGHVNGYPPIASSMQPSPIHNIIGFHNLDFHRVTDVSVLLMQIFLYSVAVLSPSNATWQTYFCLLALGSRLWYSLGIGYILDRQSKRKKWSRHFVKYGESTEEAWRQWKGLYHLSMTLAYTSFVCASWKMYHLPPDWSIGMALLRHVLGFALIALQLWTIVSIYESLGEFGWFFGDFFFDYKPKLTYSGIYRFLNNPERVIGLAGVWGAAIITWSKAVFFLALLSHVLTLAFIQFIERPHMQKLYGESLRQDSGVSRIYKRSLPRPLQAWQGSVDRIFEEVLDVVEDFIDTARPKVAAGVDNFVQDTKTLLKNYPARITISRVPQDLAGLNPKDYNLQISGTPTNASKTLTDLQRNSGRESDLGRKPQEYHSSTTFRPQMFEYGAPITIRWRAPLNHSKKDWIGLYMVTDNFSREVTRLSSQGRWAATTKDAWDISTADVGITVNDHIETDSATGASYRTGECVFSGDKLWWTQGVFEFRLHHNGGHSVMAVSLPFEIRIGRFDEDDVVPDDSGMNLRHAVEEALLPVVCNCFDRDPEVAPSNVDEMFGASLERDGPYARRVVFAVHQMFGIEFAPEVVLADGCVKNLAWRVVNAKKVLQPYAMSPSRGRTTPT